jgi:hypothetical protein
MFLPSFLPSFPHLLLRGAQNRELADGVILRDVGVRADTVLECRRKGADAHRFLDLPDRPADDQTQQPQLPFYRQLVLQLNQALAAGAISHDQVAGRGKGGKGKEGKKIDGHDPHSLTV